jgi:Tfp pilus assembly protein FimT
MPRKVFESFTRLDAADVNTYLSNEVTLTSSTATTYTVATEDRYKTLMFTSGSNVTVSIGTATAFEPGERVDIMQDGAGTVTINRSGTVVSFAGRGTAGTAYSVGQRYEAVSIVCVDTNAYRIIGNAKAV